MTKPVSVQQDIRLLDAKGVPRREIARRLGVSAGDHQEVCTDRGLLAETASYQARPESIRIFYRYEYVSRLIQLIPLSIYP